MGPLPQMNRYSQGDKSKGGTLNLRVEVRAGALWLRVNLGAEKEYAYALVKTSHPQLKSLLKRVYAGLPYNAELMLKEGKLFAHFSWSEALPPPVHTKENGVLGIDVNRDPYHLALAVVFPDGNLLRHLTLPLEEVDSAPNKGAKELLLLGPLPQVNRWKIAHQVVATAEEHRVALATERLKYLRKSKRGDGTGRRFRRKEHRFAYRALLEKIHTLAQKRGVEALEVDPPGHLHDRDAQVRSPAFPVQRHRRRPRDREKGSGVRREAPQGLRSPSPGRILPRPRRGVPPKPLPGAREAQGGGGEPLPQARAFPGDGEGPPSAFPSLCLSELAREPVEEDRRKELPRRPSLAGPEGRPLPSSSSGARCRGIFPPSSPSFWDRGRGGREA